MKTLVLAHICLTPPPTPAVHPSPRKALEAFHPRQSESSKTPTEGFQPQIPTTCSPLCSAGMTSTEAFPEPSTHPSQSKQEKTCSKKHQRQITTTLVTYSGVEVNSIVSAKSSFLSKSRRNAVFTPVLRGPSPCHYSVKDAVIQKTPKVPFSCFKSTSARIQPLVSSEVPGPGAYSPYQSPEPVRRTILPRRHYLGISAPALIPPKDPPLPGPGQYNIVNYDGPPKHLMASAAFVSGTSRWTQETRGQGVPGPGSYEPNVPTKHSFLYNHAHTWIPA
ncbi:O(6)-methylguanine-induced apoptosis 2 isoform X2 [Colossoma macropomum]|uniref:O(6)-methylguanine-induced apoptosis 2 isoform X2 n=1 Tax=Colossoma macropomum TaxID=42526 RepID=UPI00186436C4|nr:O(6)-methylguanine-induced apoptosis 2 isoform X2 [Colossoma macropomum]